MFVLGIDFGGGASKATLIDDNGKVVATAKSEYATLTLENGGREQNPDDWVKATLQNIKNVLTTSKVDACNVKCLCFDAATHTAVLMDDHFNVVRNSIHWTDSRAVKQKEYLLQNYGEDIFARFKHGVDTIWTLPQLLWIKQNEPKTWAKVKKITFAKDYVRHIFTGDFVTDYIEAEGSLFFEFDTHEWSEKYLKLLGLSRSNLPTIVNPLDCVGHVSTKMSELCGLTTDTAVICGSTDTAMEVFASGAIDKGQMTVKLATAGRICLVTDNVTPDKNLVSYSHLKDGLFYPGTATKSCAQSMRWFRDNFGGDYYEIDRLSSPISVGCDGLIFHPYLNGELTPYGDPNVRGNFFGVSLLHTKGHFSRGIMEGVGLSLKDCLNYLKTIGKDIPSQAFLIGGGAQSRVWPQIVADCLNMELILTQNNDSSFGSAMCAGIYAGFFADYNDAVKRCQVIVKNVTPIKENVQKYNAVFEKYKKIANFIIDYYNE